MEQDPNKIKGIAGLLFIVGALVMTFAVPLTMAPELPPLLFGFGEPGGEEDNYDIGGGSGIGIIQGVAQEVKFDRDVEIQYLKVYMRKNPSMIYDFEVGISPSLNKADIENLATIPVPEGIPPTGWWDKHWEQIEIPKTTLEANRSYYIVFYANETQSIQGYEVWKSSVITKNLDTYLMRTDMTNMPKVADEAIFGKSDVALKIYGEYVTVEEEEEEEEAQEVPPLEQPKNQVLIIGSILFAIGFGILFSMLELPIVTDNILILAGISALAGILWFVFVANPWMVMSMAGMIGGR